jgi:hypothetical protein
MSDSLPLEAADMDALLRLAEALVFASPIPVSARALTQLLPEDADVDAVIAHLRARYAERGVQLVEVAEGLPRPISRRSSSAWCRCPAGCRAWRWRRWRSWHITSR